MTVLHEAKSPAKSIADFTWALAIFILYFIPVRDAPLTFMGA